MAKELIISANVYEKKVALIEDGIVTEFYVERRDENQGVVGNLYKGRVMKVLPGMQSAFVDIGLERDAFLYVSDFTDFLEEDEDVDFREVSEAAQKPQEERGRRDRKDREPPAQRPERRGGERVEAVEAVENVEVADVIEQLAEIADESILPQPQPEEELEAEALSAETTSPLEGIQEASVSSPSFVRVGDRQALEETTPGPVFERIADDDLPYAPEVTTEKSGVPPMSKAMTGAAEPAATEEEPVEGKGRRSRSRKKAVEAEPVAKSSRRSKKSAAAEEKPAQEPAKDLSKAAKGAAKRPSRKKKGEASVEESSAAATAFERIVDEFAGGVQEEKKAAKQKTHEAAPVKEKPAFQPEPEPEWRIGSLRSQVGSGAGFERIADDASEEKSGNEESARTRNAAPGETSSFKHISDVIPNDLLNRLSEEQVSEPTLIEEDREASVRDYTNREEFAVRRGGRGRRRPPRRDQKGPGAPAQQTAPEGEDEEESASAKPETYDEKSEPRPAEPRPTEHRRAEPPARREPPPARRDQSPGRRERGGPPTISDLLREGQEVLVQIAKEPIAKKGARITSHIALPGRFLVYMPTVNHIGVSRKIPSDAERLRLKRVVTAMRDKENAPGGFIARTACAGIPDQELNDDLRYLIRTWNDIRKKADRAKPPSLVHRDLDLIQRILRDQLADDFSVIRVDNETEYARIVEFVNRVQPRLVNRVKLYTGDQPIFEKYNVQPEVDKAVKPRVWLKSGGYIVINQTEALVAIDVNTGKFVGKSDKLEDTITKTNLEAAKEIVRQIRLRDLGGIIIVDFIDMEERKNRMRVTQVLQEALMQDRSPSKILSINDFGLLAITRKRVKQSLERTLCAPCPYCQGGGMVKSAQTMCFEILEQTKAMAPQVAGSSDVLLRVSPVVAEALHTTEHQVLEEIEAYFRTPVTIEADYNLHQEQFDFAVA